MIIPTFIINLKTRTDRRAHIVTEFQNRDEFRTTLVEAEFHEVGAVGLWNSIRHIIKDLVSPNDQFVLICEDDHVFTENYSKDTLFDQIMRAQERDCQVLVGGVSWFMDAVQVSEDLFQTFRFSGTQFIIIFRSLFEAIVHTPFAIFDCADFKLAALSSEIYFIFPFISVQKEFGYSDVTSKNNGTDRVEILFENSTRNAQNIYGVRKYYDNLTDTMNSSHYEFDFEKLSISTYVVSSSSNTNSCNILRQFEGKREFNTNIVSVCSHENDAYSQWLGIRKAIELAIANDEHVIIICDENHKFAPNYTKQFLLKNIIESQYQRCDYLCGGTPGFHFAVPISSNRFWTNHCADSKFMVLYRKVFKKILDAPFDKDINANLKISELSANKMILFPFVSSQSDINGTNIDPSSPHVNEWSQNKFPRSEHRLRTIQAMFNRTHSKNKIEVSDSAMASG